MLDSGGSALFNLDFGSSAVVAKAIHASSRPAVYAAACLFTGFPSASSERIGEVPWWAWFGSILGGLYILSVILHVGRILARSIELLDSVPRPVSITGVTALRTRAMRHVLAVLLMAVLTLAGVGRGLAPASDAEQAFQTIPGVVMPICHSGGTVAPDPDDPGRPVHHDCCDQCVLCAAALVSAAPELRTVAPVSHDIVRSAVVTWTVRLSRARTPRQSQGPPAA